MNIIKHRRIFYLISALILVPGIVSLLLFGLKPSIDFTGGSIYEFKLIEEKNEIKIPEIQNELSKKYTVKNIKNPKKNEFILKFEPLTQNEKIKLDKVIEGKYGKISEISFETVGATIGKETEINALIAVAVASVAILAYIAFVFRKVSKPVSSWKYGVCAIIALLHDVLVVIGIFSILGYLLHIEVDSLFITALLTVMGFSVHDTIVVFDRIRENLKKYPDLNFDTNVNNSILETMNRSLNTSMTVLIVLFMLLLFGGESIKWFVIALLIGIISGTYSSIFTASPMLVSWYHFDKKKRS